jgi:hypothetical protein
MNFPSGLLLEFPGSVKGFIRRKNPISLDPSEEARPILGEVRQSLLIEKSISGQTIPGAIRRDQFQSFVDMLEGLFASLLRESKQFCSRLPFQFEGLLLRDVYVDGGEKTVKVSADSC